MSYFNTPPTVPIFKKNKKAAVKLQYVIRCLIGTCLAS